MTTSTREKAGLVTAAAGIGLALARRLWRPVEQVPTGALMEKGLQLRTGQTHVQKHTRKLLAMIEDGTLDTTFLISHCLPREDAAKGYHNFRTGQDEWTNVILKPGMERAEETAGEERQAEPA